MIKDPIHTFMLVFLSSLNELTEEVFKGQVATSSIISANELFDLRRSLVLFMLMAPWKGLSIEEIQEEYDKAVAFIESVTSRV
jgi:hypothetical protein